MKILIVDDEELARKRLLRMLNTLGYEDISDVDNAEDALKLCSEVAFDLVFLDINMPKTNGLELGYELKYMNQNIAIIYQSAYDEHALKAYDIGAVGYLVKPFSIEQLKSNIERVKSLATTERTVFMSKTGENYLLLKPEEIYYIKADLSEVTIRSASGFSYLGEKISDIQKKLAGYNFFRIHRSYLINVDEIKNITTIEQSKLRFSFKHCNDEIESSKDGAKAFREAFNS
ncbi:LytR/AlgR family response regulator transcription factor [Sulfurimonas marina]|uniref:Response regulator transcription factor n=1 Tax=Sulfurimonas marina TaxID=2590551 RepID=A0A7M3V9F9_9BACT|nr:LytTR family DNA-binding domain-containing protein [Sulfurimonas marina]QOP40392.1 response regulator transcription factor [Sulfurimonas marina]